MARGFWDKEKFKMRHNLRAYSPERTFIWSQVGPVKVLVCLGWVQRTPRFRDEILKLERVQRLKNVSSMLKAPT